MKFEFPKPNGTYTTSRFSAKAETAGNVNKAVDNPQAKQLRDMQDAMQRLQAMPSPRKMAQQAAMDKVGMLKQRIDALKALLLHASPEEAKALARELKSIAAELASVAKGLGTSSGQGGAANATQLNSTVADTQLSENSQTEVDSAPRADDKTKVDDAPVAADSSAKIDSGGKQSTPDGDEKALKTVLLDARKLLKEAIGLMKSKLASAEKEAKHDTQAAEKSLLELDTSLSQGESNDFYTGRGDPSVNAAESSMPASPEVSGLNINLVA